MSIEQETAHLPVPVTELPPRASGALWYRTLDDAVDAWAHKNDLHGEQELPRIYVFLHSHIGGWSVE